MRYGIISSSKLGGGSSVQNTITDPVSGIPIGSQSISTGPYGSKIGTSYYGKSPEQLNRERALFAQQQEDVARKNFALEQEKAGFEKQKYDIAKSMFNPSEYAQQLKDEREYEKKKRAWELQRMDDLNAFRNKMGLGGGSSQQAGPSRLSIARSNMG